MAIRVRNFDGVEIIEAFQSTIVELNPRVLFTAPQTGIFILEVREIDPDEDELDVLREVNSIVFVLFQFFFSVSSR